MRVTDAISVDDYAAREDSVLLLELSQCLGHQVFERVANLLAFVLNLRTTPVLRRALVHRSSESKNRFGPVADLMVDVDTTHHRWLVKEGHIADGPWLSSDLRTDLNQNLAADRANVLAPGDCVCEHYLRRHRQILQK